MIKLLITGDFCPINRIEGLIQNNRLEEIYNDFLPFLNGNDINITNLECPLTEVKAPIQKIGPNLIATEKSIEALNFGGFKLVTLSNNHILDQGENGLTSTIQLCKKNNIDYVGAGRNLEEASRILIKKVKDSRIAFLNFSENEFSTANFNNSGSNPLNPVKNFYSIRSAREKADYVIVIVHGGHEGYHLPSPRMVETYRFFIDAGADIVVGHHTHCFSGYESYKDGKIFYSLGNFIFDKVNIKNTAWNYGFALMLFLNKGEISFQIIPYKQCSDKPGIHLLDESMQEKFNEELTVLNNLISDKSCLLKEWEKFISKRRDAFLIDFECFNFRLYKALRYRKFLPGFLSKRKKLKLLNIIRCESHRDITLESLKLQ